MRYGAILLVFLIGCAGHRNITNLSTILPDDEVGPAYHVTVDSVLRHYFTEEAYEVIKDIPLVNGPGGYAAGTTFLSNVLSVITGNGFGRKVILPVWRIRNVFGVEGIIHEYIHHLDDMCRDGELDLFDLEAFRAAYLLLERDFKHAWIAINANRGYGGYPWFYHVFFSMGDLSERVAYAGSQMGRTGLGPDYMKAVFGRILRFHPSTPK